MILGVHKMCMVCQYTVGQSVHSMFQNGVNDIPFLLSPHLTLYHLFVENLKSVDFEDM